MVIGFRVVQFGSEIIHVLVISNRTRTRYVICNQIQTFSPSQISETLILLDVE